MKREEALQQIASTPLWDFVIVGGGATGLGAAVEAASRGYKILLLERHDFAKGTSSRSTKLSHGGVRYLRRGEVALVREALRERGRMLENAPGLVRPMSFVIPVYGLREKLMYAAGLRLYGLLAGKLSLGASKVLSREDTLRELPGLEPRGVTGGVRYFDGQFDDARYAIALLRTLAREGGSALNYCGVTGFLRAERRVTGVVAIDDETGTRHEIAASAVLNATGIFTDELRALDDPSVARMLAISQGTHIVVERGFMPSATALMIPNTEDGRVLFAIPYFDRLLIGTTDGAVEGPAAEPKPREAEVDYLLEHAAHYMATPIRRSDILSVFAGQRPLLASGGKTTERLSRSHSIFVSPSSLVNITGGKWTTYRQMGEEAVDRLESVAGVPHRPSRTASLRLDQPEEGAFQDEASTAPLDAGLPWCTEHAIRRAIRDEMACTLEDLLARRCPALFVDAAAAMRVAPKVGRLLASELGRDEAWEAEQVSSFLTLARQYIVEDTQA